MLDKWDFFGVREIEICCVRVNGIFLCQGNWDLLLLG